MVDIILDFWVKLSCRASRRVYEGIFFEIFQNSGANEKNPLADRQDKEKPVRPSQSLIAQGFERVYRENLRCTDLWPILNLLFCIKIQNNCI